MSRAICLLDSLRSDANRASGFQIDERGRDFAPVAKFQRALAEPAICDQRDSVSHAAVDFDVSHDAFALGDRIGDAEFAQAEHRQAHAEHLPGAQMAVRDCGQFQIFVERLHRISLLTAGFGATSCRIGTMRTAVPGAVQGCGLRASIIANAAIKTARIAMRRVFQNFLQVDRLRSGKASAIDVHVQQIGARNHDRKSHHDRGEHRRQKSEAASQSAPESREKFP